MTMNRWIRTIAFLACFPIQSQLAVATTADRPPNFIVILCDNLGYGDIEPFGSTVHRTPHLNRMAAEGRKLTHFYVSAGVCTPSRASLMTGCYSQRVGMHDNPRDGRVLRPISPYGLNPNEVTIAEALKERGYATAIVGKWHLGDQPEFLPTQQGFDEFFGVPYSDDMTQAVGQRLGERFEGNDWPPLPLMEGDTVIEAPTDRNALTRRYTERTIDFIQRNREQPFFLLLSHAMPGSTSQPFASERFRGQSANGPWGDAVEELDWSTGQILDALRDQGISDRTLVIWTSDNGAPSRPASLERGTNRPLHGRGYTTSEGAFRVPTIAWWPGSIEAGSESSAMATTMDLLPTFAALAGSEFQAEATIDGRNVSNVLTGDATASTPHEAFFYYEGNQLQAVRSGRFKLFVPLESFVRHPHFKPGLSSSPLLFDVVHDVDCSTDISAAHADIVTRLTQLANDARGELGDLHRQGTAQRPAGRVEQPIAQTLRTE